MPKVGGKSYSYDKAGMAAAKKAAKKTGKKMTMARRRLKNSLTFCLKYGIIYLYIKYTTLICPLKEKQ